MKSLFKHFMLGFTILSFCISIIGGIYLLFKFIPAIGIVLIVMLLCVFLGYLADSPTNESYD